MLLSSLSSEAVIAQLLGVWPLDSLQLSASSAMACPYSFFDGGRVIKRHLVPHLVPNLV